MTKLLWALAALSMIACSGGDTGPDGSPDNGGDGTDSGGPDPTGTGFAVGLATKVGVEELCLIDMECGDELYHFNTGEVFEVVAPASCTATVGVEALTSQFGFPVHVDSLGDYWAAPPAAVTTVLDDTVEAPFRLFKLFEPGDYRCFTDKWDYDASAPDFKGVLEDEDEDDPQPVSIDQNGKVEPEDVDTFGIMGGGDYIQVEDDHLVLREADGEQGLYITQSAIGTNFFEASIVWPSIAVYDLHCDLE